MSLDVYLHTTNVVILENPTIYVRRNGHVQRITTEEWNLLNPDHEPVRVETEHTNEVFWYNITHNLNRMAREAGIYEHLWRPDEIGITKAEQLIEPLKHGLKLLRSDPKHFKTFNPENGWGDYEWLVEFVEKYLQACRDTPSADVSVSR